MKGIIIYKGKYGATQQYAEWLGKELSLPFAAAGDIKGTQLKEYDFLLIGTSVYIGKLQIQKWLKSNLHFIRDKKIFLFQVAATAPEEKEKRHAYNLSCIPEEIIKHCEFYFLHGRMTMQNLSWKDRFMLKLGARLTKDPIAKKTMLTDFDEVRKENIEDILIAVKNYLIAETPAVSKKEFV